MSERSAGASPNERAADGPSDERAAGPPMDEQAVLHAARLLLEARRVCVSTGAGMSAESGVATFRDQDGLWSKFDPDELATPAAFVRNPVKVWAWYRARRAQLRQVAPHAGHTLLAEWEQRVERLDVVTQNVDGLHERAGSTRVIELHGRLDVACCVGCAREVGGLEDLDEDPRCADCGQRLRPGVVWFGELLPADGLEAAWRAAEACDVIVVIGTSGVVQPAASLSSLALARGAAVIEINPTRRRSRGLRRSGWRQAAATRWWRSTAPGGGSGRERASFACGPRAPLASSSPPRTGSRATGRRRCWPRAGPALPWRRVVDFRIVAVLFKLLVVALGIEGTRYGVQLLGERLVQHMDANQLDYVRPILVSPGHELQFDQAREARHRKPVDILRLVRVWEKHVVLFVAPPRDFARDQDVHGYLCFGIMEASGAPRRRRVF